MNGKLVFVLSLIMSLLFLLLERLVGIGVDFHIDSVTYLTSGHQTTQFIQQNPRLLFNNMYYVVSSLTGMSANVLISINMLLFALTNMILVNCYVKLHESLAGGFIRRRSLHFILFIVCTFSLYRLHLSIHVLKDTIVVLLTVLMLTGSSKLKYIWLPFIAAFRLFGVTYATLFLRGKLLSFAIFVSLIFSYLYSDSILATLLDFNDADMNFREGASVPSFQNLGFTGILIRMLVWPALMLSGAFFILSPSLIFLPIALSCLCLQIWAAVATRAPAVTLSSYGLMAILAALAPGFASYQRYCLPIVTVLPLLVLYGYQSKRK